MYVQIFSLTDHAQALHGRYQGAYNGINAEIQTSELKDGVLKISKDSKANQANLPAEYFNDAKIILAYRHSDTGILTGTSETLFSISKTPWEDLPGLAFQSIDKKTLIVKLWAQEMKLKAGEMYRIHFGKTIVYIKNFGFVDEVKWTDEILENGPSLLHADEPNQNISIAPDAGSGLQIKMGQETQN